MVLFPDSLTPPEPDNVYRWGTVNSVIPLSITLDGDAHPLNSVPDSLVSGLRVGSRVWCQIYRRRIIIVGRAKGGEVGGNWMKYSTNGMGFSAGVPYKDTNVTTILDSSGPIFATPRLVPNGSRLHIDVSGWYSFTGRFLFEHTAGGASRQYVEYRVWETSTSPSSLYSLREGFAYDEGAQILPVPYLHLDEGNEVGIGTYAAGWSYNLRAASNITTIRLIEATA